MKSTKQSFQSGMRSAMGQPNIQQTSSVIQDANRISQNFNETERAKKMCPSGSSVKKIKDTHGNTRFTCTPKVKSENKEATTSGSSGAYSQPLFSSESKKMETKEATTTASVGSYETPAMWSKSMYKKDWGPSRKTQIPGGQFVSVKKRCKKYPYCNQGDIKALKLSNSKKLKEAINKVASQYGLEYSLVESVVIKNLLNGSL